MIQQKNYTTLSIEQSADILKRLEKAAFHVPHNNNPVILSQKLSFALLWERIIIEDYNAYPQKRVDFLIGDKDIKQLGYSPNPYKNNDFQSLSLVLNDTTITDYLFFYCDYLKAVPDALKVIYDTENLQWIEECPSHILKTISSALQNYPEIQQSEDSFEITLPCQINSSLYAVIFEIDSKGQVKQVSQSLIADTLPLVPII
jgi:hypothetical protein